MGKPVQMQGDHVDIEVEGRLSRAQGDKNMKLQLSKKRRSWMVPLFVVANVAVFFVTMMINDCPRSSGTPSKCIPRFLGRISCQPLKENPLFGPSSSTLERMGGLEWSKVVQKHQGWRLIACICLHAGVVHIFANMLGLVSIGLRLEQEFGFLRISILYLLSGFGGSLLSALFIHNSISVGASGAVFGLLGAMLSELLTNWTIYDNKCAALGTLIFIIVNFAVGVLPHIDYFAHIGGFMSGFLLGFVFLLCPQFGWGNRKKCIQGDELDSAVKSKHNAYQYALWLMVLILLIVGYTVGLVVLLRGVNANDHCSWCYYLSSVPTGNWSCRNKEVYCLSSQSASELTLTCQANGKVRNYPFGNVPGYRIEMLCCQLCN